MINLIGGLAALLLGLLLTDYVGMKEAKILTIIGWLVILFCNKGDF